MTKFYTLLCLLYSSMLFSASGVNMAVVPANFFVNKGKTNFDSILIKLPELKKEVEILYNQNELTHEFTKAFSEESTFKDYWEHFSKKWTLIDLNKDGNFELLFQGKPSVSFDDKEYIHLYTKKENTYTLLFGEAGKLLAYKIQPNTKNIVLFHHKAPCCNGASHNIYTLRILGSEIKIKNKFFAARDTGEMKGKLLPNAVSYSPQFKVSTKEITLRWSAEIIKKDAWKARAVTNKIISYPIGSIYRELYKEGNKRYVLMLSSPNLDFKSEVINPVNFADKAIFGWIIAE